MFSLEDTIVAISTPLGRGAIGVVRLSGPDAADLATRLIGRAEPVAPRHATFATLSLPLRATSVPAPPPCAIAWQQPHATSVPVSADVRDQVVVTFFPQPNSYTGQDVVEISAHGSAVVLQGIVHAAMAGGARLAEPGEFTLRAFLNGKLDLIQAEAVADLIESVTPLQARAAFDQLEGTLTTRIQEIEGALFDLMARLEASLDFPDEGYHFVTRDAAADELAGVINRIEMLLAHAGRGRIIREGAQIAIVGTPNVGKSSLFNRLLDTNRAIVTPIPGTTRDLLTERVDMCGISTLLVDTAGIRDTGDAVEQEGVSRARAAVNVADLTLVMLDRSRPLETDDQALLEATRSVPRLIVANKIDLPDAWSTVVAGECESTIEVSVKTNAGVDQLIDRIATALGAGVATRDVPLVSNMRHVSLLRVARTALGRGRAALGDAATSEEFVLADLQEAGSALQEITGRRTTEDLLAHIFSRFCLGK
jgi:tRNA modification GTPase